MAEKQLKSRVALRKDLLTNFNPTFVALNGEVLFVQQTNNKIRVKIGDGITPFYNLAYLDTNNNIVVWGYYLNNKFYTDSTYIVELEKSEEHIYIDQISNKLYIYNGTDFICADQMIPSATDQQAGIMKLYKTHGSNEDGTITQKFFTDSIDDIIFSLDSNDSECLVLAKPW